MKNEESDRFSWFEVFENKLWLSQLKHEEEADKYYQIGTVYEECQL